jgi:methylmalonyl-CoA mutase N-terminal domain/subunit
MAAVLGGCQSLHTNSLDEAYALPSEHAVTLALRTQQVIAHETGITAAPDPLGGSYFVERLTLDIEEAANTYIRRIDALGGMIPAIERGFPQAEVAQASYEYQRAVERGEEVIVGVNRFTEENQHPPEILRIGEAVEQRQLQRIAEVKRGRSQTAVDQALDRLRQAAQGRQNTMPVILEAVKAYATVGEICGALKEVFGAYTETAAL